MPLEPSAKRVCAFIDGQNLFHAAKEAFGYQYPNYDATRLTQTICDRQAGWRLERVRFYTGVPDASDNAFWNHFWAGKLAAIGKSPISSVYSRPLRYRHQTVPMPDGSAHTFLVAQEKGIDIRLALDVVHAVRQNDCDIALIFSQDQDLSEVADEVRAIAKEQERWVKIVSAFPDSPALRNRRGINKTDWIRIDRAAYDAAIDPNDYRPLRSSGRPPGATT